MFDIILIIAAIVAIIVGGILAGIYGYQRIMLWKDSHDYDSRISQEFIDYITRKKERQ